MAMKCLKDLLININTNPDTNPDGVVFFGRRLPFQRSKEEMMGKGQDELVDKHTHTHEKGETLQKAPEEG